MSRYLDQTGKIYQLIEELQKLVKEQSDEIRDLKLYKTKLDEYYSLFTENKNMIAFNIFKHFERIVPTNDYVTFSPVSLSFGKYIVNVKMTYVNRSVFLEAGVVLSLIRHYPEEGKEEVLENSASTWYGNSSDGSNECNAFHTISLQSSVTIDSLESKPVYFVLKKMEVKNSMPVLYNESFPCTITIF